MIKLPFSGTETNTAAHLPEGVHRVTINAIKLIQTKATGEDKLVVEYENGDGFFADFLGFKSENQARRTFAYVCRLHELAGLTAPKNGGFDETALVGTACQITLVPDQDPAYIRLADFPVAAMDDSEIAF